MFATTRNVSYCYPFLDLFFCTDFVFSFLLSFVFFFHCDDPARKIANIAPSASQCGMQKRSGANRDRAKRDGSSVSERRQKKRQKKFFSWSAFSLMTQNLFLFLANTYAGTKSVKWKSVDAIRRERERERKWNVRECVYMCTWCTSRDLLDKWYKQKITLIYIWIKWKKKKENCWKHCG